MEKKEINSGINELIDIVKNYLKLYLDLLTIQFVDKLSLLLSKFFYLGIVCFFLALTVGFSLISLALYLGELFNSYSLGFLSMSGLSMISVLYYVFKPARGKGLYKLFIRFFSIILDNNENIKS